MRQHLSLIFYPQESLRVMIIAALDVSVPFVIPYVDFLDRFRSPFI